MTATTSTLALPRMVPPRRWRPAMVALALTLVATAEAEECSDGTDAAGSILASQGGHRHHEAFPAEPVAVVPSPVATVAVPAAAPRPRVVTAAIRQRRRQPDPQLDVDIKAWLEKDPTRPRLAILGPVTVDASGAVPDERRLFYAEIIIYLAQRGARGADRNRLDAALWPDRDVKDASRRVAITRARRWLGENADGEAWLPDMGPDRNYRLREGYLLDWHLFHRLRTRGEAHGPAGVKDLRAALALVRGAPLDGADRPYAAGARNPYTWLAESDIHPDHVCAAIVDAAHHLAALYLDAEDTAGVRWAVAQAWLADPGRGYDQPWRDFMVAQHRDGHTAQLQTTFAELMRTREAEVPEDLDPQTYQLALRLLGPAMLSGSSMPPRSWPGISSPRRTGVTEFRRPARRQG